VTTPERLELSGCFVDFGSRVAVWPDEERTLTPTETRLLAHLASLGGRIASQRELLREVWEYRGGVVSRTVKTTMGRLRAKVERDPRDPDHLLTSVGAGYRFKAVDPRPEEETVDGPPGTADPAPETRTNLPAVADGPLVGRDLEQEELGALLPARRLLTLTGPAGVGKTRLALAVAAAQATTERFREVLLCELETARTPDDVIRGVASVLSAELPDEGPGAGLRLAGALRSRGALLLVLDDFDLAAMPAATLLAGWVADCPALHLLVTCRSPLEVAGERVVRLSPLGDAAASELFELLAGQDALSGYRDPSARSAVLQQLDGLPLAIEMAATWTGFLDPDDLRGRLDGQLQLLRSERRDRPGRHASLRAAFASSWELLDPDEVEALTQAAVFPSAFTVDAAEAVIELESGAAPLTVLRRLIRCSLVRRVPPTPGGGRSTPSLRLLHAIRELASERGRRPEAELRHARWFGSYGDDDALEVLDAQGGHGSLAAFVLAASDLELAVRRGLDGGEPNTAARALRALLALARFRGPALGREHLVGDVLDAEGLSPVLRGRVALDRAGAQLLSGAPRAADALLDIAGACADASGDRELRLEWLRLSAASASRRGDPGALDLAHTSVGRARELGSIGQQGRALLGLGILLRDTGAWDRAGQVLEESVERLRGAADVRSECTALDFLGRLALDRGRPMRAWSLFEAALERARHIAARPVEAGILERLAMLRARSGAFDDSHRLYDQALALRRLVGDRAGEARTLTSLGSMELAAGMGSEARDSLEQALPIALELGDPRIEALARGTLGQLFLDLGHHRRAGRHLEAAVRLTGELGLTSRHWSFTGVLAELHYVESDLDEARRLGDAALDGLVDAGVRSDAVSLLERLAERELDVGEHDRAGELLSRARHEGELSQQDGPATLVGR
jgi:tetratricopeptide (TPR) repeat protein/DNA-binding winged helix-turn-helix (wHTH) protein